MMYIVTLMAISILLFIVQIIYHIQNLYFKEYFPGNDVLTCLGRVMHISIRKLTIIHSDNGLSPGWHEAIIWMNDGILLIEPFKTSMKF